MSWLFSQALVEEYSGDTYSDGAPSAPSSGNPTPQAYCAPDKMKAFSRLSRFGMTCKPLTDDLGADVLMSFLAAFPVRTSAQPERAQESTASEAACGDIWRESFARFDRDSCSWKTPHSLLPEDYTEFSGTWPRWGMMRGGECWERTMPEHLTSGTASGLWPTPRAGKTSNENEATWMERHKAGKVATPPLSLAVQMWPTPCTRDYKGANTAESLTRKDGKSRMDQLPNAVAWATPTRSDYRSPNMNPCKNEQKIELSSGHALPAQVGGSLNPTWVEWLMGWPLGWTDLRPSGTDKFQQWQHSHGKFSVRTSPHKTETQTETQK